MKKILFYCQYHLGMGHLVRSLEILRGLAKDFHVCFVKAGWEVTGFEPPPEVEVVTLPLLISENRQIKVADSFQNLEEVKQLRQEKLLQVFDEFQPDILMTEGYPFNKHQFEFEAIPLLEKARASGTKVVCSLRDIVMAKYYQNRAAVTGKICQLMNRYYDLLLVHSDAKFQNLEDSFPRIIDINCPVKYTGYVAQSQTDNPNITAEDLAILNQDQPIILVSVGGGQLGHYLLDYIVQAGSIIKQSLPHQIVIFAGPFFPDDKFLQLQKATKNQQNITLKKYTPNLLAYMEKAELSLSLCGYNTTMNLLRTGVRSLILPSNKDWEQKLRAEKLARLGLAQIINPDDLPPERLAQKIITNLNQRSNARVVSKIELEGANNTSIQLQKFLESQVIAA